MPEEERTDEVRDSMFIKMMGKDERGYCRTYRTGILPSDLQRRSASSSQSAGSSQLPPQVPSIEEITEQVTQHVTQHLTQFKDDIRELVMLTVNQCIALLSAGSTKATMQV